MSPAKKIVAALVLVFVAMQFIQPARNQSDKVQQADMIQQLKVPTDVAGVLKKSCYDCHSNNTRYPWYANVQPVGWMMAKHVKDGKADLNFNDFGNYSARRQLNKLKGIRNSIKDGTMPLSSYALIHQDAVLSGADKALVIDWASKIIDSLSRQ